MNIKNKLTFLAILFVCFSLKAQWTANISTASGYENNINQAPDELLVNDNLLEKETLYMSSFYQDAAFYLRYKYQKKKHDFTFRLNPEMRYYFTEQDANREVYYGRMSYKYEIKKNLKWENSISYKINNRDGQNLDQNELNLPFGYNLFKVNSGLRFRLYKSNRSYLRLSYWDKQFDDSPTRSVQYARYAAEYEFKNIFWKNHLLHSYGFKVGYSHRDYFIRYFRDIRTEDRIWNYINANVFYKFQMNKNLSLKSIIYYENRIDKTDDNFGYMHIRPEIAINYKSTKIKANLATTYTFRKFKTLEAENEEEDEIGLLTYNYLKLKGDLQYNFNNKLSLISEVYYINRISNNENISTSAYRSYINSYLGVGIRYNF